MARTTIEAALADAGLGGNEQLTLTVDDQLELVQVHLRRDQDALEVWRDVRDRRVPEWDVTLTTSWGGDDPDGLLHLVRDRDWIAACHRATQGPQPATWGVDDILGAARAWDDAAIEARLDELDQESDRVAREVWGDRLVADQLEATELTSGRAPASTDVPADVRGSASRLDRWLLDWELAHAEPPRDRLQAWFDPAADGRLPVLLWVIPRPDPFAAIAVQHWWDSDLPFDLAVMQRWARRWDASLTAHWGTMLQVTAAGPPRDVDAAWALAREQDLLCDALLAPVGEQRRHLAIALMEGRRWFLHSRP